MRSGEISRQRLDLAIIHLMESYRSTYIAEHRLQSSRVSISNVDVWFELWNLVVC